MPVPSLLRLLPVDGMLRRLLILQREIVAFAQGPRVHGSQHFVLLSEASHQFLMRGLLVPLCVDRLDTFGLRHAVRWQIGVGGFGAQQLLVHRVICFLIVWEVLEIRNDVLLRELMLVERRRLRLLLGQCLPDVPHRVRYHGTQRLD